VKKFKVILDFLGAQDGVTVTQFKAGEIVEISDYLAPHISDWAEPYEDDAAESPASAPAETPRPQLKAKRGA
jgi:hypothetical protein